LFTLKDAPDFLLTQSSINKKSATRMLMLLESFELTGHLIEEKMA